MRWREVHLRVKKTLAAFLTRLVAVTLGFGLRQYTDAAQTMAAKDIAANFPDCVALNGGSVVCAYVECDAGCPMDLEAAWAGDFGSIELAGSENLPPRL